MSKLIHALCLLGLVLSQSINAQSLSPTETQIKTIVTTNQDTELEYLKKLVNINSGTNNIVGVRRVGNLLHQQFTQLGFKTHWVEEPPRFHRAGTLIAEHKGKSGKRIILLAHLDTVFSHASQFQTFKRKKILAYGPGVIDDKGGVVVILYALKALQQTHTLDDATITVVLTGDEEDSGKPSSISRKALLDIAKQSDITLEFEFSLGLRTATISRRGISGWILKTTGKQAHSAGVFTSAVGDGAIFEIARILNTFRTSLSGEKYLTFNPGVIVGGTHVVFTADKSKGSAFGKSNVIASSAFANGDLRFVSDEQKNNTEKKMSDIVHQSLTKTSATITFQDGIPSMLPTEKNRQLLNMYSAVSEDLGYGSVKGVDPGARGAGDISYISAIVPQNLAGLGPSGEGAHSEKELLDIPTLSIATQRAALLIYRLTHSK